MIFTANERVFNRLPPQSSRPFCKYKTRVRHNFPVT